MFNRIRISTTLVLILILCGILQIGSNGMSFWAFRDDLQRLNQVEQSNQQRAALAQTRAVMLQASTALNKAGTLTALSYPAEQASRLTQAVSAFRLAASPLTNKPQTPSRPASEQPPAQPRLRIAEQDPNWETF